MGTRRSSCWMSRLQGWTPSLNSACGENPPTFLSESWPSVSTDMYPHRLQESHTRCLQEPPARSRPHHTLHGGGRGRVRPCRHHGFGTAEVCVSSLSFVTVQCLCSPTVSNRCIGSIQHLKGKYGRGYSLEVKLREELTGLQQVALLHKEILRIFPHAARQER